MMRILLRRGAGRVHFNRNKQTEEARIGVDLDLKGFARKGRPQLKRRPHDPERRNLASTGRKNVRDRRRNEPRHCRLQRKKPADSRGAGVGLFYWKEKRAGSEASGVTSSLPGVWPSVSARKTGSWASKTTCAILRRLGEYLFSKRWAKSSPEAFKGLRSRCTRETWASTSLVLSPRGLWCASKGTSLQESQAWLYKQQLTSWTKCPLRTWFTSPLPRKKRVDSKNAWRTTWVMSDY